MWPPELPLNTPFAGMQKLLHDMPRASDEPGPGQAPQEAATSELDRDLKGKETFIS